MFLFEVYDSTGSQLQGGEGHRFFGWPYHREEHTAQEAGNGSCTSCPRVWSLQGPWVCKMEWFTLDPAHRRGGRGRCGELTLVANFDLTAALNVVIVGDDVPWVPCLFSLLHDALDDSTKCQGIILELFDPDTLCLLILARYPF